MASLARGLLDFDKPAQFLRFCNIKGGLWYPDYSKVQLLRLPHFLSQAQRLLVADLPCFAANRARHPLFRPLFWLMSLAPLAAGTIAQRISVPLLAGDLPQLTLRRHFLRQWALRKPTPLTVQDPSAIPIRAHLHLVFLAQPRQCSRNRRRPRF